MNGEFKSADDIQWIKYAIGSAVSFGLLTYLLGDVSNKYGTASIYPIFIGTIPIWIIYQLNNRTIDFYM